MKINSFSYYAIVVVMFCGILFSVKRVVNTNRIIIGSEEAINPTQIYWSIDEEDSLLRVKDPLYLSVDFYLDDTQKAKFEYDTALQISLYGDTLPHKGSLVNLEPPYLLWKKGKNDTIKVFKDDRLLNFIKRN